MKWFKKKEEDWRPEGLKRYQEQRALITEIMQQIVGRTGDLEEWLTYHIVQRDLRIIELENELSELKKSAQE